MSTRQLISQDLKAWGWFQSGSEAIWLDRDDRFCHIIEIDGKFLLRTDDGSQDSNNFSDVEGYPLIATYDTLEQAMAAYLMVPNPRNDWSWS